MGKEQRKSNNRMIASVFTYFSLIKNCKTSMCVVLRIKWWFLD